MHLIFSAIASLKNEKSVNQRLLRLRFKVTFFLSVCREDVYFISCNLMSIMITAEELVDRCPKQIFKK